ncbi:MAG: nucleotidyl transferase AbiEii/AbiGii toxin family protein [Acidobacteriota bacterium]
MAFVPNLAGLPPAQRALWPELGATPEMFTLYGGTALALRLGHRTSIDFDFFANASFDPDRLQQTVPFLTEAERVQVAPDSLTCRIDRGGPVLVSFFGGLGLGQVAASEPAGDRAVRVASLLDIAGTKAAVVQKRAESKDYLDIDALLRQGIDLPTILAAGKIVYGRKFNPLITLKALSYFDDLAALPAEVRERLRKAVGAVDPGKLPSLTPYAKRPDESGSAR